MARKPVFALNLVEVVYVFRDVIVVPVIACLALLLIAVGCLLGRRAERRSRRRGGLLELDTPAARAAVADDPDDWFAPTPLKRPVELQRCRPDRGVHYHGDGDRCECGQVSNVYAAPGLGFHPFAGRRGGADAA